MTDADKPLLAIELKPNASLAPDVLRWILIGVITVNVVVAVGFAWNGAWPVVGFCGLDVLLIWWALKASMKTQRIEAITITAGELVWQEQREGKAVRELRFPRAFVRARMIEDRYGAKERLVLASRGKFFPIALGLGVAEREQLADILNEALRRVVSPA